MHQNIIISRVPKPTKNLTHITLLQIVATNKSPYKHEWSWMRDPINTITCNQMQLQHPQWKFVHFHQVPQVRLRLVVQDSVLLRIWKKLILGTSSHPGFHGSSTNKNHPISLRRLFNSITLLQIYANLNQKSLPKIKKHQHKWWGTPINTIPCHQMQLQDPRWELLHFHQVP